MNEIAVPISESIMQELFGKGPAAPWVMTIYFFAGALGTFLRVLISTGLPNKQQRMIVETILGGAAGVILPNLGAAWLPEAVWAFPPVVKAFAILFLSGSTSLIAGEILGRFKGGGPR